MTDDVDKLALSELVQLPKRADSVSNKWVYDEDVGKWLAPDGTYVDAPPAPAPKPAANKGQFKKGNKFGGGPYGNGKTSYRARYAKVAREACERGLTDLQIADLLSVSEGTLYAWRHKYPPFAEAFRLGKRMAHDRVERSLYHKAIGYTYDQERVVGNMVVKVRQHLPPDTAAAIFYLKNRRPQKWKDVQRHETGPAGAFDQMTDALELRKLLTQRALDLGLIMPAEVKLIEGKAVEVVGETADKC